MLSTIKHVLISLLFVSMITHTQAEIPQKSTRKKDIAIGCGITIATEVFLFFTYKLAYYAKNNFIRKESTGNNLQTQLVQQKLKGSLKVEENARTSVEKKSPAEPNKEFKNLKNEIDTYLSKEKITEEDNKKIANILNDLQRIEQNNQAIAMANNFPKLRKKLLDKSGKTIVFNKEKKLYEFVEQLIDLTQ